MNRLFLIGAGGHARMIVDVLTANGKRVDVVVDPVRPKWLDAEHVSDHSSIAAGSSIVIGLGGVTPDRLRKRLGVLVDALAQGCTAPPVIHPSAIVSPTARIGKGVQIAAGAIIQAHSTLGDGVIVNSGAIVEHDAVVGAGSHIAPGAIVLGAAVIGAGCMIGAGAVVLPEIKIDDGTLVSALTRRSDA